jgi:hypothetical protein
MTASIFLATPAFGGTVDIRYHEATLKLTLQCQQQGIALSHYFLTTSAIITEARNELAKQFLASSASHLLFIDADIGFSGSIINKALQHNTDILCHPYPRKSIDWQLINTTQQNQPTIPPERAGLSYHIHLPEGPFNINDGLTEVIHAPTGCMIIKRAVFERIMQQMPDLQYQRLETKNNQTATEKIWGFFDLMADKQGHRLGEDYSFCERARLSGSKIYADISHVGKMEFRGRLLDKTSIS